MRGRITRSVFGRTAVACGAADLLGTLVTEGIVGYRLSRGELPPADRYLVDVGAVLGTFLIPQRRRKARALFDYASASSA